LQELVRDNKIKARTKWKEVYALFKDDERYLNMLGNPGSNQLELFWDVVDELDQKLDSKIATVQDAIKRYNDKALAAQADGDVDMEGGAEKNGFTVAPETTEEEYQSILKRCGDPEVEALGANALHEIFVTVGPLIFPFVCLRLISFTVARCGTEEAGG
jgi:pre-mRNA-processing factor 40